MTLPPNRIGDKGQRYLVETHGYPNPGWNELAYTNDLNTAITSSTGMMQAPTCTNARVTDRNIDKVVYEVREHDISDATTRPRPA